MGLREKAQKSLQPDATADRVEQSAPMLLELEASEREAEAKALEAQLRKELADARRLSEAKDAEIARQTAKRGHLEARVKELETANAAEEREASQRLKAAEAERDDARKEITALQKFKSTAKEAESTSQQLRKRGADYPDLEGEESTRRGKERPSEDALEIR